VRVIGWDIGGANVKAALVSRHRGGTSAETVNRAFEIWKDRTGLPDVLRAMAAGFPPADATAVTMTAELSDVFRTKREGVNFVLDAVGAVMPGPLGIFTTDGSFATDAEARARPLAVAASNWMATSMLVARHVPDALLVDIGTTTTDLVSIRRGRVVARGRTDPERLLAGELVYTGAVRTNVAAIVPRVPLWGGECPVAAEYFAVSGDVHVLLGDLAPASYTGSTPDGRAPTADFAAERLARVVCADVEMLSGVDIHGIARFIAHAQVQQIAAAIRRVAEHHGERPEVIATGLGDFLVHRAAAAAGLRSRSLSDAVQIDVGWAAPAVAIAWLLAEARSGVA
jgi:(4-(4-[2-(gamma-L-glutamylamino)ethyl]phenoxymethyl)furan-2-yl)methanamine synthase